MSTHFLSRSIDPGESARALYAAELRFHREQAGLSLRELAQLLHLSVSHLSNLETGRRRIQPDIAQRLDVIYGTNGFFTRNLPAARSPHPQPHLELDYLHQHATEIRQWAPTRIPDPLQTPAYAHALHTTRSPLPAPEPPAPPDAKPRPLTSPNPPLYWVILGEAALHHHTGNRDTMAGQLTHLADLADQHRILLQILPFACGPHPGADGALTLMAFPDTQPVAHLTAMDAHALIDTPDAVRHYHRTFETLAATALPPHQTHTLLHTTHHHHRATAQS
ncbi:helix-turn-helix domain-containing protein [Actinacidiphila sp. ITFR-21]|uniref:helix-turn-helix domain-containing protein n=1 Tax=Actinacidiphila sp. ITFR-21 TaxID=3075199 RepID=UPI00288B36A2|nr:helix-turn-helix transcriptional regulator [Streptomyces sp. ITFR-21]WNI17060.1 helix-turn-helix transcriptional regulator [Streptomyces sp. ITFR-21]